MIDTASKTENRPEPQDEPRRRFLETPESRPALGKVTTDEEARLAAEIEQLRD